MPSGQQQQAIRVLRLHALLDSSSSSTLYKSLKPHAFLDSSKLRKSALDLGAAAEVLAAALTERGTNAILVFID
eukprot:CAMPEP_0198213356 /NCGR_PEP_ID=MMETSP1445-20131203/28819_1 /TAXON_ID=36898 /ORGANISM="Pyramimonas sp., Strain CCMP2087" /LENGTH=73 /DNA_ID=CAMNT_0043887983 /DNA_START=314 /DNA_END=533 /DNA_ORIENTATION=+